MNVLPLKIKKQILTLLVEGNSARAIERITGVQKKTILRLLAATGTICLEILNEKLQNLHSRYLEIDEIWTFVQKKQRHLNEEERGSRELGDQYVFVAIDPETKLVPAFAVGKRDNATTWSFLEDLKRRYQTNGRLQITTDPFPPYRFAVPGTFGDCDYAQLLKSFAAESNPGRGRYSPPEVVSTLSIPMQGNPDPKKVSTSIVERQNLTMRTQMRRFTRLTNGFSKKLDNLKAAVALYFVHYNFMRKHQTLKTTPAIATGLANRAWWWEDVLNYVMPIAA